MEGVRTLFGAAFGVFIIVGLLWCLLAILAPPVTRKITAFFHRLAVRRGLRIGPAAPVDALHLPGFTRVDRQTLAAVKDGVPIALELSGTSVLRISAGSFNRDLSMRRQGFVANLGKGLSEVRGEDEKSDYTIGVPAFDDQVVVRGPEADLRAALTPAARALVLEAIMRGFKIERGRLVLEGTIAPTEVERLIHLATETAQALTLENAAVQERLVQQLRTDPEPEVRLRCLQSALAFAGTGPIAGALRDATKDEDWRVSILAATLLGEDGRPTLIGFLEDESAPDSPRLLAMEALGSTSLASVQCRLLRARLDDVSQDVRKAAIRALGASKDPEALPIFLARLAQASDWERPALVEALGRFGDPSAARALRTLFAGPTADVVTAVALGECGGIEDVERLRVWAEMPDRSRADARAALDAIAKIQARHGGESGGLALSDPPAGAGTLSIPDADAGALSDAEPRRTPTKQST